MKAAHPQFLGGANAPFFTMCKELKNKYFESNNISPYGNAQMHIKTVVLLALLFILYYLLFVGYPPPNTPWYICVLEGADIAGIGFCIMHDANHGSYSKNKKVNMLLGYTLNLVGGINFIWKKQHNQEHHPFTNIAHFDHDIDVPYLLRLSPKQNWYIWHRVQFIYTFGIYSIYYFLWIIILDPMKYWTICREDWVKWKNATANEMLPRKIKFAYYMRNEFDWDQFGVFFISKAVFALMWIVIPTLILGFTPWNELIKVGMTCSIIISLIFQLAHTVRGATFDSPNESGSMEIESAVHQVRTTFNFSPKSWFAYWYLGGLNYQREHHLFPQVCHIHYRGLSEALKPAFKQFNVPRNCNPSFLKAVYEHIMFLLETGNPKGIPWYKLYVQFEK